MKRIINTIFLLLFIPILLILTGCGHRGYEEKDGKIYCNYANMPNWHLSPHLVKEADPATFKTVNHNQSYFLGKDKNHVFLYTSIVEEADPSTFKQIKDNYWKDKDNVYYLRALNQRQKIIQNADPKSFELIANSSAPNNSKNLVFVWSKDKNRVFYKPDELTGVHPTRFVAINQYWGKNDKHYYHKNLRLDSLDYNSAETLNGYYIKDKNRVFYRNKLVVGANPSTFIVNGSYADDDKNMYFMGENKGPITEEYRKRYIEKK